MNTKNTNSLFNILRVLRQNFSQQGNSSGMTLMELLLAAFIGSIVLMVGGTSLYNMTVKNKNVANQIETRTNVSRAMDFIKYESKQALFFEYTDSATLASVAPTFALPTGASVPLAMSLPNLPESIIYYVAPPPNNSLWQGPLVLYRWGPKLNTQGEYNDHDPSNWSTDPLVDNIDNTALTPNCGTGWNVSPSSGSTGFYACISSDQKAVNIYINGEIEQAFANSPIYGDKRALVSSVYKPSDIAATPTPITSNPLATIANCQVNNGILSCDGPATLTMEIIGDDFSCNGSTPNPILTQFMVDPDGSGSAPADYIRDNNGNRKNFRANDANYESSLELDVTASTEVVVESIRSSGSCGASSRRSDISSDQPFIESLEDGDTPPSNAGWNGQNSVETYLIDYTDANGNIDIADNQIIYLFEMYTSTSGSTYDLQDNVLIVTIAPPNS